MGIFDEFKRLAHPYEDEDDDAAPTRRIDFKNLKFGKDYEI